MSRSKCHPSPGCPQPQPLLPSSPSGVRAFSQSSQGRDAQREKLWDLLCAHTKACFSSGLQIRGEQNPRTQLCQASSCCPRLSGTGRQSRLSKTGAGAVLGGDQPGRKPGGRRASCLLLAVPFRPRTLFAQGTWAAASSGPKSLQHRHVPQSSRNPIPWKGLASSGCSSQQLALSGEREQAPAQTIPKKKKKQGKIKKKRQDRETFVSQVPHPVCWLLWGREAARQGCTHCTPHWGSAGGPRAARLSAQAAGCSWQG